MLIEKIDREGFQQRLVLLQKEIENDPKVNLKIPERLIAADPMIVELHNSLTEPGHYVNEGLVSKRTGQLDVAVSPANVSRALCFLDTLVKAWKARGHGIALRNDESYATYQKEEILIKVREKSKRVQGKGDSYSRKQPTGLLYFKAGFFQQREWIDGKLRLEEQLLKILTWLEVMGQLEGEERVARERRNAIKQQEAVSVQVLVQAKK